MKKLKLKKIVCFLSIFSLFIFTFAYMSLANAEQEAQNVFSSDDMFINNGGISSFTENVDFPEYSVKGNGVKIIANESGATVRYKNVIDISNFDKSSNLIEFQILSNQTGLSNFSTLYFTLTDIYDANNIVEFRLNQGWRGEGALSVQYDGRWMFLDNLNYLPGYEGGTIITDQAQSFHGTWIDTSFDYNKYLNSSHYDEFKKNFEDGNVMPACGIALDYSKGSVYVSTSHESDLYYGYGEYMCVVNMVDSTVVGTGQEWKGFTTGECNLDITFGSLKGESGIIVSEIAGQSLSGTEIIDETEPNLYIDVANEYLVNLPNAQKNKTYDIPFARAVDIVDGDVEVKIKVYKGIIDVTENVLKDQTLLLNQTGKYKIEYEAIDSAGNVSNYTMILQCESVISPIRLSFGEGLEKAYAGTMFYIPEIEVKGGSGVDEVIAHYSYNGIEFELDSNRKVYLDKVGTIRVDCEVSDFIGSVIFDSSSLEIAVVGDNTPVLNISGVPYTIVAGKSLKLPDFQAYNYSFKENESGFYAEKQVFVNGVDVTETMEYTVTESVNSMLEVVFTAITFDKSVEEKFYVKVVNNESIFDAVLIEDGVDTNQNTESASIYSEFMNEENFELTMVNPLSVNYLAFEVAMSNNNANCFDVILEEFYGNKSLFLRFTPKEGDYSYVQVNGEGKKYTVAGSFINSSSHFNFTFDKEGYICDSSKSRLFNITTWSDGSGYSAFTKGAVKMCFKIYSDGSSVENMGLRIYTISNQKFLSPSDTFKDKTVPVTYFYSQMKSSVKSIGEKLLISQAEVYDVLDSNASIFVSVTAPDGTKLLDKANCNQDYIFNLNQYGYYSVIYYVADSNNKSQVAIDNMIRYSFKVKDEIAPTVNVVGIIPETIKLGETLNIPLFTAYDNYSEVSSTVFIVDGGKYYNKICSSYKPMEKGNYILFIYVVDEAYNTTIVKYLVNVV